MSVKNQSEKVTYGSVKYYPEELDLVKMFEPLLRFYGIRPDFSKVPKPYLLAMYFLAYGHVLYYGDDIPDSILLDPNDYLNL